MPHINKIFLATLILAGSAHAGVISTGSAVAANPNHNVNFERTGSLASSEILSNQFANQGVTFVANSGDALVVFNTASCNPGGLTGNAYMAIGVTPNCNVGNQKTVASLVFDTNVAELSFSYVANGGTNYVFEALLNGAVVSSQSFSNSSALRTNYLFKGSNFDTVRFTENSSSTTWFWVDNLSWRSAPTSSGVPEPTSLALLGLGLAGVAASRRKRKQA